MKHTKGAKILHITTLDMTTYFFHLPFLEFLKKQGFDVSAAFTEGRFAPLIRQKGIKTFNIPISRRISPIRDLFSFFRLYNLIKQEKFDLVHTSTSKAGFLGRAAAHLAKVPLIIHTIYELPQNSTENYFLKVFYRFLERLAALWADKLITISNPNLNQILREKIASEKKVVLIPIGIDVKKFDISVEKEKKKRELSIDLDSLVIGTVGRLEPPKGHKYLLEVATIIIKIFPKVVFLIIGDGPLRKELEEEIRRNRLEEKVILAGFREDLAELLHTIDIFVSASLWEGFGVALAEAMVCGLPVVATRVGGVVDFVEDGKTGILVPPRDSKALSEAIILLLSNLDKANYLGKLAKEKIIKKFSQESMIQGLWSVYKELLFNLNEV